MMAFRNTNTFNILEIPCIITILRVEDWRLGSMSTLVTRNGHASLQLMHAGVKLGLALIMCLLVPE